MAYSFQTFTLNQVLTAAQMNQVEVNIRDHLHGQSSVSTIDQTAVGASAIGQGELKTTTASGSTTLAGPGPGPSDIALTGGTYSWWTAACTGSFTSDTASFGRGVADPGGGVLRMLGSVGSLPFARNERYVQASPPYNFGPLFIFLLMNQDGTISSIEVGTDPTWAYHGPTNIIPQRRIVVPGTGEVKGYRTVETFDGKIWAEAKLDPKLIVALLDGDIEPQSEEIEITLDYKDTDMDVAPHPWFYNAPDSLFLSGKTVVLLEPGTAVLDKLNNILQNSHASDVVQLIKDGYLKVDNDYLNVSKKPQGVQMVRAALKNTGTSGIIVRQ